MIVTEYRVQDWCNLFSSCTIMANVPEMVKSFMERDLSIYETLRYLEIMSKKTERIHKSCS